MGMMMAMVENGNSPWELQGFGRRHQGLIFSPLKKDSSPPLEAGFSSQFPFPWPLAIVDSPPEFFASDPNRASRTLKPRTGGEGDSSDGEYPGLCLAKVWVK